MPLLGTFVIGWFWVVFRRRRDLDAATRACNVTAATFVALSLVGAVRFSSSSSGPAQAVAVATTVPGDQAEGAGISLPYKPDIYYLILDGYTGENVLKTMYSFDNSGFYDALRQRGFFVASRARCNYPTTFLSLAS
jgi:hypothetical protein